MKVSLSIACVGLLLAMSSPTLGRPTEVVVRVLSQDAKFVGDDTGGASVTLRDARSGKILAKGKTKGTTGDTARIMEAVGRAPERHGPDTASYVASIDIDVPTLVDLEAEGPLGRPQSVIRVASQRWIMPGEAVAAGDGWLVELPGLAIQPTVKKQDGSLAVETKVELMCGCPITPGGTWDAADYRVTVSVWKGDRQLSSTDLGFSASPGIFRGQLPDSAGVGAQLIVFARNIRTGNSGLAKVQM